MTTQTNANYRFATNAGGSQSNDFGNYIIKRGMGEIRKPSWQRTETVVRILPCYNFSTNSFEPFRYSSDPMDYGDWIRRYDAVRGFGENGLTFLLYDQVTNPTYDLQNNPCVVLYRAIKNSITAKQCLPDWPALLNGAPSQRAPLSRHTSVYLTRVGIFRIKSKDMATSESSPLGLSADGPAYFFEWPKSAGEKLCAMLEDCDEDYKGDLDDYNAMYKNGDVVALDKGKFIHIYEEGTDVQQNSQPAVSAGPRAITVGSSRGGFGGGSSSTNNFKGYDIHISGVFKGFSPALNTTTLAKIVKDKQKPWDQCLQFFTDQQQAFLIQDGFPASAIMYAWKDHRDFIKDETRSKAVGRTSVAVDPRVTTPADARLSTNRQPVTQPTIVEDNDGTGSWGSNDWNEGDSDALPAASTITATNDRESKAAQALANAKARNAGRV